MKSFKTINGKELLAKEIQEIPFVVKDLIPVGLTLIAGAAKAGKSWLALWLSIQIAKGEKVWGYEYFGDMRTVDVTVRRLREKLEDDPSKPEHILTKRGVGYYFDC